MRALMSFVALAGLAIGCGGSSTRPPSLPCPDGAICAGGGGIPTGGGIGTPATDGGARPDVGPSTFNVAGSVSVIDQLPPTTSAVRLGVTGWTVRASDDPDPMAVTLADGTFFLSGVTPTIADGGVNLIGVRAIAPNATSLGSYRQIRAGAGSATLDTYGSERLLEAVAAQGGAPSPDLGHVIIQITEATDPSIGVPLALVTAGSGSTTFYDSALTPGQLTPSIGTGPRGFALVLNVPAGDVTNGGSVSLNVQVPGGTPTPANFTIRVFPNTISWTTVRVVR